MFYTKFVKLCNERNISPSAAAEEIGLSRAATSKWAIGQTPRKATLLKITEYFGVPEEYFSEEYQGADSFPQKEETPAASKQTEVFMKMYDMLTPDRQLRLYEFLSDLVKEQMQEQ